MAEPNHLRWKYWEPHPNWTGSRSYVYLRDRQIVAHAAIIPNVCLWREQRVKAVHIIDWAAKADSGGSGVTLMKQIGKLTDVMLSVGGSDLTQQILPMMGFKDSGTTVIRYARPLRPLLRLANAAEYKDWRLAPQIMRGLYWTITAPSHRDAEWSAHRILPNQLAGDSAIWPRPTFGAAVFERLRPPAQLDEEADQQLVVAEV